jgi:hypothetical protein
MSKIYFNKYQLKSFINECVKQYLYEFNLTQTNGNNYQASWDPQGNNNNFTYLNGKKVNTTIDLDTSTNYKGNEKKETIKKSTYLSYVIFSSIKEDIETNKNSFNNYKVIKNITEILDNMYKNNQTIPWVNNKIEEETNTSTEEDNNEKHKKEIKTATINTYNADLYKNLKNNLKIFLEDYVQKPNVDNKWKYFFKEDITETDIDSFLNIQDNVIKLSLSVTGKVDSSTIQTYYHNYTKNIEQKLFKNRQIQNNSKLKYLKTKIPNTNTDVISLFPFADFGGTELIKKNRLSLGNKNIKNLFPKTKEKYKDVTFKGTENDRSAFDFNINQYVNIDKESNDYGSAQHFLHDSLIHAKNVLNEQKYIPNFVICVPSTSNFNEGYIKKLSEQIGNNCKSYNAFIVKDWVGYTMSKEDEEKLKQALLHTKYLYNHEDDKTVDVFKATIMKGVKNSFLYKISKHIPQVYKNFNNLTDIEKNYLLKYFLYLITKKEKKILALLGEDYNPENELERLKKTFYKIKGQPKLYELCVNTLKNNKTYKINKTIVNNIINELQIYYPENNNNTSIKIDINSILYQDSDVQMTSLIPSGNIGANSKVSGAKLRPLIVTVYFVNNQQYELTTEGKTMMEIISNNIKQNLQEDKKNVELSHQNILIFDDDMDTGASLKLCVDTMNKVLNDYRVSNNTQIKCLTLFTKTHNFNS